MKLIDLVAQLPALDEMQTIYAKEPWNESCEAVIAPEDEGGARVPPVLQASGFSYFLEVDIAQQFLHDWFESTSISPSESESCARLIEYAVNDA